MALSDFTPFPMSRFQRAGFTALQIAAFQATWTNSMSPFEQDAEALILASHSDYAIAQVTSLPSVGGAGKTQR